jgi:hypothetical protein
MDALRREFYTSSRFVSIYHTIEETFSDQLLKPYGLKMYFRPETMDIFQEDEAKRSVSLGQFVSAVSQDPTVAKFGMEILGYDLTEEQELELDNMIKTKEEEKLKQEAQAQEQMAFDREMAMAKPNSNPVDNVDKPANQQPKPKKPVKLAPDEMKDLALWFSKAKAWNTKGKGNAVDWENKHLREEVAAPIRLALAEAENELDIVKAFEIGEIEDARDDSGLFALADAINRAAEYKDVTPVYNMNMPGITTMSLPAINLTAQMPAQGTVTINVPEQAAPVVNVASPSVTVKNEAPVNNIEVKPADVILPKVKKEKQTVKRDAKGQITGSDTSIEYEA